MIDMALKKVHIYSFALILAVLLCLLSFTPLQAVDHSYRDYNKLLKGNVVLRGPQSWVRYGNMKKDPALLDRFVENIESVSHQEYKGWTGNQKKAFLINAYNALTLKLILTRYPDLESIKDLGGFFSSPWKKKFFTLFGKKQYLDYIEHEMLRKDWSDARVHFVLVCASIGCPALRSEAYVAERLDLQMDEAMKSFLGDKQRNRFNAAENRLEISSIFKWYKQDFVKAQGSIEA